MKLNLLFFFSLFFINSLKPVDLTISRPGIYILGGLIRSVPTSSTSIINITVSDVVLDLNGYVVSQGNNTASVEGISINTGVTDVIIQNGTIRNVTGNGITINSSCSRIKISNILFENCANASLNFQACSNVSINNVRSYNCGATGGNGFIAVSSQRLNFSDVYISFTLGGISYTGALLSGCSYCQLKDVVVQNLNVTAGVGFADQTGGNGNIYTNCIVRNCTASVGVFNAFTCSSPNLNYRNCLVVGTRISAAAPPSTSNFFGFNINGGVNGRYSKCMVINNFYAVGQAFAMYNGGTGNFLTDCVAAFNRATVATTNYIWLGYNLASANNTLQRCIASNQSSAGDICLGIIVQTSTNRITDCLLSNNKGNVGANSAAISVTAGANNLYSRNVGFNNNTTAANSAQFVSVPAGDITIPTTPSTQNVNAVTAPWTNLSVAT